MDRAELSRIAHTDHPIAAPVAVPVVRRLLERLDPAECGRVVDLGCGAGAWLLELLGSRSTSPPSGSTPRCTPSARPARGARGVADRLTWAEADAATWRPVGAHPRSTP